MTVTTHTLSVLVEDKPGVLARVAALFSRRGFNIESLAVGATEAKNMSRMTIVVSVEDFPLEQITKQLNKLINVIKIVEQDEENSVSRELALIKVRTDAATPLPIDPATPQAERDRLARDLHDSIKQQLFSISISAAAVRVRWDKDPAGAHAALDDVQHSAQAAMVEMNALLKQLRPNPLETVGLIDALREQCEALAFRTGAEVTTFFGELPPEAQLPAGAHETLFRIAQEALSNIARHARAQRVHLRLELDPTTHTLRMEIRDDGQGFDEAIATNGMGLSNMRERAHSLQGHIDIDSASGQGTTIQVEISLLEHKNE